MSLDFDFGFNAVSLEELNLFQEQQQTLQETQSTLSQTAEQAQEYEQKLIKLRSAIQPLLTNLKLNPEREYILWPNRTPKIEEFEAILDAIVNA